MNNIEFVVFDFDGVFTDGKCYFNKSGVVQKYYNIKDGMAVTILKQNNIKTGILSSFSCRSETCINDEFDTCSMVEHLNFDYEFIGKADKIMVLNAWIDDLQIKYENVAYIGDDINDIQVLKSVGFSACPNDAAKICKENVDYICDNTGGNGCVREFVDHIIENKLKSSYNSIQHSLYEIKKEVNYQLDNISVEDILKFCNMINECTGNIYMMGIGKSGNIASHFSDLLKSICVKCMFVNPLNVLHGDMGIISHNDVIVVFSKSGKTTELLNIIPYLKQKKCKIVGICNDSSNLFYDTCDETIILPMLNELNGQIDKIPTNSVMSQLILANVVTNELKKNIDISIYKQNHPAGSIGKELK